MEVILQKHVKGLGQKNELVKVKGGYGQNYLIPQGLAILADPPSKKLWQENVSQSKHKHAHELADAKQMAEALALLNLEILTKASEKGNIYGSVTALQVAEALKAKGHVVGRQRIYFKTNIRTLGKHHATIDLHKDVRQDVQLHVIVAGDASTR